MSKSQTVAQFMEGLEETVSLAERHRLCAMLSLENTVWQQGFCRVAGVDEAGRGPLAGPLVAAAVVLAKPLVRLNDSKRVTDACRRSLFERIRSGDHFIGVASISAAKIDALGIQAANYMAMRCAIEALQEEPDFVLVDGYSLPGIEQPSMRVVKGDSRSLSIAAASIIAKVTRDNILLELDACYPQYGFARHKGYGTAEHLAAIRKFGLCPEHRKSFAPCRQSDEISGLL